MLNLFVLAALALTAAVLAKDEQDRPVATAAEGGQSSDEVQWQAFKHHYGLRYGSLADEQMRRGIFVQNLATINSHNANQSRTYQMDVNRFSAMTDEEKAMRLGRKVPPAEQERQDKKRRTTTWYPPGYTDRPPTCPPCSCETSTPQMASTEQTTAQPTQPSTPAVPTTTTSQGTVSDWRAAGRVTPVKDQGSCGSCWAFATNAAVESRWLVKYGSSYDLSEQNLMDCSWSYGNNACNGGWEVSAYKYIRDVQGLNQEGAYPYAASSSNNCKFNSASSARFARVASYVELSDGSPASESQIMAALQSGPVVIAVEVVSSFYNYKSGVYSESRCSANNVNHAMVLVGWGQDSSTNQKYWLVKNSWGTWFGEQGYIRMARGGDTCGIASWVTYPIVA